jgi:hypothetical protein
MANWLGCGFESCSSMNVIAAVSRRHTAGILQWEAQSMQRILPATCLPRLRSFVVLTSGMQKARGALEEEFSKSEIWRR